MTRNAFPLAICLIASGCLPRLFRSGRPATGGGELVLTLPMAEQAGVGFGAISTFIVLLYAAHAWSPAWLPFTALSIAFIGGRAVFGHLPDKLGGAKVACVCIVVAAGQALIWQAHTSLVALVGVVLTGLGYSLVYPGLGLEAIRRAPPQSRGLAIGSYTAFLDLSLGVTGPALGLVAGWAGLSAVFLASTAVVLCAAVVALQLMFMRVETREVGGVPSVRRSRMLRMSTSWRRFEREY